MSAEITLSAVEPAETFPYRALSRGAIVSVICFVFALPGLLGTFWPVLSLTVIGVLAALVGIRGIKKYPNEFSGLSLAKTGLALNAVLLLGGTALHSYIYLTEVPDGYTRVQFYKFQQPETAPDIPTEVALENNGKDIFLKGYIHPSSGGGLLRRFILVPDLGTCCFGGQPKSTDMIEVSLGGGLTTKGGLMKKKLAGEFRVNPAPQQVTDFDNNVFYRLKGEYIR